ncbi:hypothetical protein ACH9L7_11990 [Haloferax sp. S1W]|uniref:DUF7857 domain-containing protein n=1 Tax=Haloferax sp. S1W TaxID=3377110 RepID=UPI0037CA389C
MDFDVDVSVSDAVALVTVRFDNTTSVDQRVRLRNRLDGPVLPPHRSGVPEDGWDETGFEGVVPADSTLSLGYACPGCNEDGDSLSSAPDDAVSVDVLGRADSETPPKRHSPDDAIRELGPCRPPADVVPAPELGGATVGKEAETTSESEHVDSPTDEDVAAALEAERPSTVETPVPDAVKSSPSGHTTESPDPSQYTTESPDPSQYTTESPDLSQTTDDLGSFLQTVERRIELAERLDGASVAEAADTLSSSTVRPAALEALDADRAELRQLAARATALADRAADADPNTEALRRLA